MKTDLRNGFRKPRMHRLTVCADTEGIAAVLKDHETIFTAEEHNTIGGLGSLVAEVSTSTCPRIVHRIGLPDTFAESGKALELLNAYKLDGYGICSIIKESI